MELGYAKFALKLNKILIVNVLMFSMILPINTLSLRLLVSTLLSILFLDN